MDMMATEKIVRRRQYSAEFKAKVVAECNEAGASVARVAMSHGINANIVHGWRQLQREGSPSVPSNSSGFIPVSLASPPAPVVNGDIRVELRRGAIAMTINWPASAAAEFAVWTRELLR
jgi:transposase